eukprot:13477840-Ditylum_brightwellii.AAC.1
MASIGLPSVKLVGTLRAAVWITRFLPVSSMLRVTLVLDDSSVGAISFISCVTVIKENLGFLDVIFNLPLFKCILGLVAFWLVAKDSLHILLI